MATVNFALDSSSVITHTKLPTNLPINGPSQPAVKSSLSFPSSIATERISLRATHFSKARVIVGSGRNGGRGGGSGGDHGEGEGEAEEKRFEELPMLGWPWWWLKNGLLKDQLEELEEDSLGWQEMMVQLYEEFDDGFSADDVFSSKNAAEYQKFKEKIFKELDIAVADLMGVRASSMMKSVQIGENHPGNTCGEEF